MLKTGIQLTNTLTVTKSQTAKSVGSGGLDVLATPSIISLMEKTAWESILPFLDKEDDTVGIFLEINHIAPTPIGAIVSCTSTLIDIDKRKLTFQIEAFDNKEKIAHAIHKRFIIKKDTFQKKANNKLLLNKE